MKHLRITIEGKTYEVDVEILGEEMEQRRSPSAAPARARPATAASVAAPAPSAPAPAAAAPVAGAAGDIPSPLAGTVVSVDVKIGDKVAAGAPVITLEAMKMNTIVNAPAEGVVSAIHVQPGESVEEGKPLITVG